MSLDAKTTLTIQGTVEETQDMGHKLRDPLNKTFGTDYADGTASDQCDVVWQDQRTLNATSEDLDMAGSLTDSRGNTVTFADVKVIAIENTNTTAGQDLTFGPATANGVSTIFGATTESITIRAGGTLVLDAPKDGYAITTGTADLVEIDAGANTVTYNIILMGTSS